MARLRGGQHYPRSMGEFQAWFRTDSDCLDYLEWCAGPVVSPARPAVTPGPGGSVMAGMSALAVTGVPR